MNTRKLLPTLILGSALVLGTGSVWAAEQHGKSDGGSRAEHSAQEGNGAGGRETESKADRDNVQHEDTGGNEAAGEDTGMNGDPDNIQHEDTGSSTGDNGQGALPLNR